MTRSHESRTAQRGDYPRSAGARLSVPSPAYVAGYLRVRREESQGFSWWGGGLAALKRQASAEESGVSRVSTAVPGRGATQDGLGAPQPRCAQFLLGTMLVGQVA